MNIPQSLEMKLTFLVFTILVAVVISGAVSAGLEAPEQNYLSAYVVENGYSFTGYASIQDTADNYETMDGNHIELETGIHEEQVVVNKNLTFTGMGANPEDTVIQAYNDNGGTVTIATGISVVLENLSIWNYGTGPVIVNNGQLTIINCIVNGTYVANEVTGTAAGGAESPEGTTAPEDTTTIPEETIIVPEDTTIIPEETIIVPEDTTTIPDDTIIVPEDTTITPEETIIVPEDTTTIPEGTTTEITETMLMTSEDGTTTTDTTGTTETTADTAVLMGETSTEPTTEGLTTGDAAETTNPTTDPGIPLASLASGMLMLMGGTVVSGRKHH